MPISKHCRVLCSEVIIKFELKIGVLNWRRAYKALFFESVDQDSVCSIVYFLFCAILRNVLNYKVKQYTFVFLEKLL